MCQKIKQPLFWLRVVSVVICLIGLMRMFAVIVLAIIAIPALHIEGSGVFLGLEKLFNFYLDAGKEVFGMENKAGILYLYISPFLISLFFIVSGIFLLLRRLWAKKMLLSLIILDVINNFLLMLLREKFTIKFMATDLLIFYIFLLIFFTRRPIVQLFNKDA